MVQKYQALVYTVCHQLVPDVQEAQDLTQETFLAAWRAIDRCPPASTSVPWAVPSSASSFAVRLVLSSVSYSCTGAG